MWENNKSKLDIDVLKDLVLELDEKDPIRILIKLPSSKLKVKDEKFKEIEKEIEKILPEFKEIKNFWEKFIGYMQWRDQYLMDNLDGNKLLKYLEENNIDEYSFIGRYWDRIMYTENCYSWSLRTDKWYDKLYNLRRELLKNKFWEDFVKDMPIL